MHKWLDVLRNLRDGNSLNSKLNFTPVQLLKFNEKITATISYIPVL